MEKTKIIKVLIVMLFFICISCSSYEFDNSVYDDDENKDAQEYDIFNQKFSSDPYKDEIMRFFKYNGYKIKEKSINRISDWMYGNRYELAIQNGTAIVYFIDYEIVSVRDKSNLNFIYKSSKYY